MLFSGNICEKLQSRGKRNQFLGEVNPKSLKEKLKLRAGLTKHGQVLEWERMTHPG